MRKVLIVFFTILISVPIFDVNLWLTEDQGYENGLKYLCMYI